MVLVAVHLHASDNLLHLAVYPYVQVALAAHGLEELTIVTLTTADERGQDKDLPTGIVVDDHVKHFLLRIFHHLLTSGIAIGLTGPGEEQTQVVVYLRRRAHRGARVLVGGLLLDTDDGRQSCDLIHVGALQSSEEVTGIGREGLDIAPLSFGIDGVEGQ